MKTGDLTRDSLWRTKEGTRIAVKNMSDRHLLNAVRVLRHKSVIGTVLNIAPESGGSGSTCWRMKHTGATWSLTH